MFENGQSRSKDGNKKKRNNTDAIFLPRDDGQHFGKQPGTSSKVKHRITIWPSKRKENISPNRT